MGELSSVFGLLIESLDDEHEAAVVRGVVAGAKEAGATILCVAGGIVDDPNPASRARNFVFELLGPHNVAGLIVLTSAVGTARGAPALKGWLEHFGDLPVCCMGDAVDGYPSVLVDNATGVQDATTHLIREHGARKLGFIRGPAGSAEAQLRHRAFRETLEDEFVEINDAWIVDGDFTKESGARAIQTLFDEGKAGARGLEGIVAANDYMALGAMEELSSRGIRVPKDIRLVGFDDVESARLARPPLTTVRQPADMLGRKGAAILAACIKDKKAAADDYASPKVLPTELVERSSCGCAESASELATGARLLSASDPSAFEERRSDILAEIQHASRGAFSAIESDWAGRLLDTLVAEMRGKHQGSLNRLIHDLWLRAEGTGADVTVVQEVLSVLRNQTLLVADSPELSRRLEDVVHDARVFASSLAAEGLMLQTRQAAGRMREFQRALRAAMFAGTAELSQVAQQKFPTLGVTACVLAALAKADDSKSPASVLLGFGPSGKLTQVESVALRDLPNHKLVEGGGTSVVLPILFEDHAVGVAVLNVATFDAPLLDEISDLFATAIQVRTLSAAKA